MQTRLLESAVLELSGSDASHFAHNQLMSDVAALSDGGWQWSGWLSPKGRLVAFFACIRVDAQTLLLWLPAGGADELAARLQRFVFRSKVKLDADSGWQAVACFGEPATPGEGDLRLDLPGDAAEPSRQLLLTRQPHGEAVDAELVGRWRRADLRLGVPYISPGLANSEQFVPQWLSLQRLDAFDLKKGCYPGQEIVARMHYLGQSKRAAYRLIGQGEPPAPMTRILDASGAALGDVVWSQPESGDWTALAVLARERSDTALRLEGGRPADIAA